MKKKAGVVLLALFVLAGGIVYYFRYEIFQFSAESIIKRMLPEYVHVDRIIFNLKDNIFQVKGFGIRNPRGFQNRFLASIDSLTCRYRMKSGNILDGIEVTDIEADRPVINIERLSDGRLNINEMGKVMEPPKASSPGAKPKKPERPRRAEKAPAGKGGTSGRSISDIIKLPDTINVSNGRLVFLDRAVSRRPYRLTFEDADGNITLGLSRDYRNVLSVASRGTGFVNGDHSQRVDWVVSLNPQTEKLTMSNRYVVDNVDIMQFKPYYDRYSPVNIRSGRFSGTLVFNFDNGNIGSTNTLRLRNFKFAEKKGGFASAFWDTGVSDIIKYLQLSPGEVIFDFKIKGNMEKPRFYSGPHVRQAIQGMVVDKVAEIFGRGDEEGAGNRTDAEKVVDVLKSLLKK